MTTLADISKAARWDTLVQQGSSFAQVLDFGDVPTTGFSFRGQIRRTHQDATVLAEYTFTDLGSNRIQITLTSTQTAALPHGKLVHDIEAFTTDDALVVRLLEGRVTVTPEVTRSE